MADKRFSLAAHTPDTMRMVRLYERYSHVSSSTTQNNTASTSTMTGCQEGATSVVRVHIKKLPHKCPICSKGFLTVHCVKRHLLTHSGGRAYLCDFIDCCKTAAIYRCGWVDCHKKYVTIRNLRRHMQLHTGERNYQCAICNKCFTTPYNVTRHKKTHTMKLHTGERSYPCELCNKCFTTPHSVTRHKKTHAITCYVTLEQYQAVTIATTWSHTCGLCNMVYTILLELMRHLSSTHKFPSKNNRLAEVCTILEME